MKKYVLAFLFVLISPTLLWALPQEIWRKYGGDGIATIQLPEAWEVENGEAERLEFRLQPNLSDVLGIVYNVQENLFTEDEDLNLRLEYVSLWSKGLRLKHISPETCERIIQSLNEERFLKQKLPETPETEEEYWGNVSLIKKEFLKIGKFNFPVFTYEFNSNVEYFKIRYVVALHQDKNQNDKILMLRFLYSYSEALEGDDDSAVALANAITSKWEITPPGPYIEVSVIAVTIMSAYLLIWSGLLIKRLCRKEQERVTAPSYPHRLRHLKTFKGRLAYCPMFLLPFLFDAGRYLYPSELLGMSFVALISGTIVLSVLHLIAKEWKPWRGRGKPFRVTVFMMGLWVIVVFAFALIVGPAKFDPEETEEISVIVASILLWSLTPAVLGGVVSYIYQKYIK